MSKKDYIEIADIFIEIYPFTDENNYWIVVESFATKAKRNNSKFDRDIFLNYINEKVIR